MIGGVAVAAGLCTALFGWGPDAAWAATPRDLIQAIAARALMSRAGRPTPMRRAEFDELKSRLTLQG
ncbi:phage tail assembly chaperone [Zavarzinia aquatilis]|uniref:phage tail assembly chaperone n=1 Tax=Zavarzinia aquatilis TaxID=2211142 RepID=UPI00140298E4|nr:phage tail assembly chaperone [Zavarzinia aquatilis]